MEQNDKPVYITEWDGLSPLPEGATDVHLLEDADALPTWDILRDRPPRCCVGEKD
ncbi:hypothetical protein [Paraburkholderia sp. DGU8]|uniref:hypothetical protein n=1 Tax=Paraburkholderia sp. DGU8 TaxID=3161997 RepID=UPI003466F69C